MGVRFSKLPWSFTPGTTFLRTIIHGNLRWLFEWFLSYIELLTHDGRIARGHRWKILLRKEAKINKNKKQTKTLRGMEMKKSGFDAPMSAHCKCAPTTHIDMYFGRASATRLHLTPLFGWNGLFSLQVYTITLENQISPGDCQRLIDINRRRLPFH